MMVVRLVAEVMAVVVLVVTFVVVLVNHHCTNDGCGGVGGCSG